MLNEPLEKITSASIAAYIDAKEAEGRTVEYKELLPGNGDEDKREFLADVSSFANAMGGDILYGVTAERDANNKTTGLPEAAVGVAVGSMDAERLRLEGILRDGLDPRLPLVEMKFLEGFERGPVLIVRTGQSWASPHMVKFKNTSRFYSRSGAGKQQLDVRELRAAFAASEALPQRIRAFRDERLVRLVSGQSPLGRDQRKMLCVHLMPIAALDRTPPTIPFIARFGSVEPLHLTWMPTASNTTRYNLDGYLISSPALTADYQPLPYAKDYVQVFRTGAIEIVASLEQVPPFVGWLPKSMAENPVQYLGDCLHRLREFDVPLPLVMLVSMLGVEGARLNIDEYKIPTEMRAASNARYHPLDQNNVLLPEVLIDSYDVEAKRVMLPVLDAIYQGCGFPKYFFVPPSR